MINLELLSTAMSRTHHSVSTQLTDKIILTHLRYTVKAYVIL